MPTEPTPTHEAILHAFKAADQLDGLGPSGLLLVRDALNKAFFGHNDGPYTRIGFVSADVHDGDNQTLSVVFDQGHVRRAVAAFRCLENIGVVVRTWAPNQSSYAEYRLKCQCFSLRLPDGC
jgi:hypothetical protein